MVEINKTEYKKAQSEVEALRKVAATRFIEDFLDTPVKNGHKFKSENLEALLNLYHNMHKGAVGDDFDIYDVYEVALQRYIEESNFKHKQLNVQKYAHARQVLELVDRYVKGDLE